MTLDMRLELQGAVRPVELEFRSAGAAAKWLHAQHFACTGVGDDVKWWRPLDGARAGVGPGAHGYVRVTVLPK